MLEKKLIRKEKDVQQLHETIEYKDKKMQGLLSKHLKLQAEAEAAHAAAAAAS